MDLRQKVIDALKNFEPSTRTWVHVNFEEEGGAVSSSDTMIYDVELKCDKNISQYQLSMEGHQKTPPLFVQKAFFTSLNPRILPSWFPLGSPPDTGATLPPMELTLYATHDCELETRFFYQWDTVTLTLHIPHKNKLIDWLDVNWLELWPHLEESTKKRLQKLQWARLQVKAGQISKTWIMVDKKDAEALKKIVTNAKLNLYKCL